MSFLKKLFGKNKKKAGAVVIAPMEAVKDEQQNETEAEAEKVEAEAVKIEEAEIEEPKVEESEAEEPEVQEKDDSKIESAKTEEQKTATSKKKTVKKAEESVKAQAPQEKKQSPAEKKVSAEKKEDASIEKKEAAPVKKPVKKAEAPKSKDNPKEEKHVTEEKKTNEGYTGCFEIKKSKDDRYVFNLYASNHVIVATSQVYSSAASAMNGIKSVIANAESAPVEDQTLKEYETLTYPKWEIYMDKGESYRFRLNASNGSTICHSQGYTSKANCKNGIESIKRSVKNAEIDKAYLQKENATK